MIRSSRAAAISINENVKSHLNIYCCQVRFCLGPTPNAANFWSALIPKKVRRNTEGRFRLKGRLQYCRSACPKFNRRRLSHPHLNLWWYLALRPSKNSTLQIARTPPNILFFSTTFSNPRGLLPPLPLQPILGLAYLYHPSSRFTDQNIVNSFPSLSREHSPFSYTEWYGVQTTN